MASKKRIPKESSVPTSKASSSGSLKPQTTASTSKKSITPTKSGGVSDSWGDDRGWVDGHDESGWGDDSWGSLGTQGIINTGTYIFFFTTVFVVKIQSYETYITILVFALL